MPVIRSVFATLLFLAATGNGRVLLLQTPDLSGHWINRGTVNLLPPQAGDTGLPVRGAELSPSLGPNFTARQSAGALTVDRPVGKGRLITVYSLEGKPSKNLEPFEETISTAAWKKERLEIVTRDALQRELRRVIWLEPDGRLTVETTRQGEHYVTIYARAQ